MIKTAFTLFEKPEPSKTPNEIDAEEEIILDTTQIYLETSTITTLDPTVTVSVETSTQNSSKITTKKQSITGDLFRDSMNFNLNKKELSSTTQQPQAAENTSDTSEIFTEIVTEQASENDPNLVEKLDGKQEKSKSKQSSSPNSCTNRKLIISLAVFIIMVLL